MVRFYRNMQKVNNYRLRKQNPLKAVLVLLLLYISILQVYPQYKVRHNEDHLPTLVWGPERNNGFRVSVSLVAMFTSGATDRNGFRLGAGLTLSQTIDNWEFSTGFDLYKAMQNFGLGTTFAGVKFYDGKFGGSYYVNKYHQGDKQVSGILGAYLNDFTIRFEDDILAYPFTGFKGYDRYRTAALEVRYKEFLAGMNVYTTDTNGLTDISSSNSRGKYLTGKQISSPVYIGYARNDLIIRYGLNGKSGGWIGQNGWHEKIFQTPNFEYGDYRNHFIQIGVDKPYTLY